MEKLIIKLKYKNLKFINLLLIFSSFYVLLFMFYTPPAYAQLDSIGLANYLPVTDSKIENGDIIIYSNKGYSKSTLTYDTRIIGVVSLNPAVVLKTDKDQEGVPVISSGIAYVKVVGSNGNIQKGDFITSSLVKGTGMKADTSGFVVGTALNDTSFSTPNQTKLVQISVNPHHLQSSVSIGTSFLDIFKIGKLAASEKPSRTLQYLVAGIITIVTFGAGFLIFAKTVNTGLEALGRNPLAGRMIQFSILFNVLLIIVIIVAGTGLAYFVIRL